jgi:hypothetical protein
MIRRTVVVLSVAASLGILAAGCGGSSTSTVTASSPTTTASASTTTSATTTASGNTGNTGSTNAANPGVAQAVAACKSRIGAASQLSSSLKSKLTQLCDQAANGNEAGARKAAAQVCTEIIKATVPQQAQQFALANCPKA